MLSPQPAPPPCAACGPLSQPVGPDAACRQDQEGPFHQLSPSPSLISSFPFCCPQICFLMAVNVIGQRMNFMVILHGCWLVAILTRRHRRTIAHLWPKYCLFLTLFLLYQYLLCLGIPPALCIGERGVGCGQGREH